MLISSLGIVAHRDAHSPLRHGSSTCPVGFRPPHTLVCAPVGPSVKTAKSYVEEFAVPVAPFNVLTRSRLAVSSASSGFSSQCQPSVAPVPAECAAPAPASECISCQWRQLQPCTQCQRQRCGTPRQCLWQQLQLCMPCQRQWRSTSRQCLLQSCAQRQCQWRPHPNATRFWAPTMKSAEEAAKDTVKECMAQFLSIIEGSKELHKIFSRHWSACDLQPSYCRFVCLGRCLVQICRQTLVSQAFNFRSPISILAARGSMRRYASLRASAEKSTQAPVLALSVAPAPAARRVPAPVAEHIATVPPVSVVQPQPDTWFQRWWWSTPWQYQACW